MPIYAGLHKISVAFSPDSTRVVSWSRNIFQAYDVVSGTTVAPAMHTDECCNRSASFSQDGPVVASSSDVEKVCCMASGCLISTVPGFVSHSILPGTAGCHVMRYIGDGWFVDIFTNRTIFRFPDKYLTHRSVVHGRSIAFGTTSGDVIVVNIPPALFASRDTRPVRGKSREAT